MIIGAETLDGSIKWRDVPPGTFAEARGKNARERVTLCRYFGLDECSTWFDLPSSVSGTGANRVGAGSSGAGKVAGIIFQGPDDSEPIGWLWVAHEGQRFHELDRKDTAEFFRLRM